MNTETMRRLRDLIAEEREPIEGEEIDELVTLVRAVLIDLPTRTRALADVNAERDRQEARWGRQDHPMTRALAPMGTGRGGRDAAMIICCNHLGIRSEAEAKRECEIEFEGGRGTYTHIALEEVSEFVSACVMHGNTSDEARVELVQVAAVFVAMLEAMDRARAAALLAAAHESPESVLDRETAGVA